IGLPYAVTIAMIAGLLEAIPYVGPFLRMALTVSPLEAALVLGGGALVQILAHQIATRMLKASSVKVSPLLQVLLILALADVGGFLAIVFAPPLAALVHVLYGDLVATSTAAQAQPGAVDLLVERLARLRRLAAPEDLELASTLKRSDELLQQAHVMLDDGQS